MKLVLQSEARECGLACLAMILSAHGSRPDLTQMRQRFSLSLRGATLKQLMDCAAHLGLLARPLQLQLRELRDLRTPCILHWDLNHFVVLKKVERRHVVILDPAVGERRLPAKEVGPHFTGVALELVPGPSYRPEATPSRVSLARMVGRLPGLTRSLATIFAVAAALELLVITAPLLNQLVIDNVLPSADIELLSILVIGFGLLLMVQTSIGLARSWMVVVLGQTVLVQWTSHVFAHLVRLPLDFFERRHLGDIVSRFGAVHAIQRTVSTSLIEVLLDGIMALAALAMMLAYAPALASVSCAAVATYALLRWISFHPFREAAAERLVVAAKESTHFLETLRAMATLKLFGREQERRAQWQNLMVDVQNRDFRTAMMTLGFSTANVFIFGIENLVVLWLGAKAIISAQTGAKDLFTVGMLFAYLSYKSQFTHRVGAFIDRGVELKMLGLHAERLADIVLTPPEGESPGGLAGDVGTPLNDLAHLPPMLELRDVSFRYAEGEPWLLRNANFIVQPGESVAVTGASGAGKTTLLKIMLGLLPPTEGDVLYGGVPIRQLGLVNVRRQLGTVMQEDVLLTGNLADNISFFAMDRDPARIELCARWAHIHDDIVKMPMGYQTLVGDLGSGLSGGQRQRILLARALYKRPKILALDEATSHLDVMNERAVTAALSQMKLTRLIIAHRPETIAGAQRVVQLRGGAVLEVARSVQAINESVPGATP